MKNHKLSKLLLASVIISLTVPTFAQQLEEVVVTDTIPLSSEARAVGKIRQLTIADLLAESIRRVSNEESISALFDLS